MQTFHKETYSERKKRERVETRAKIRAMSPGMRLLTFVIYAAMLAGLFYVFVKVAG